MRLSKIYDKLKESLYKKIGICAILITYLICLLCMCDKHGLEEVVNMKCPSCGRENLEENNFCFYCGHSFRISGTSEMSYARGDGREENRQNTPENAYAAQGSLSGNASGTAGNGKIMPVWQWCLYFLALIFPYTMIVWFVITVMWAFGSKGTPERRNMARGILMFLVISVVFTVIASIILIATMGTDGVINYLTGGVATSADALLEMYGMP